MDRVDKSIFVEPPLQIIDLLKFERGLNKYNPASSTYGFEIKGSGSMTLGLHISSIESLQNKHVRRLAGFCNVDKASQHIQHIHTYRKKLHQLGIETTDTQLAAIESNQFSGWGVFSEWQGIVYVIQPYLNEPQLAHKLIETASEETRKEIFEKQLGIVIKLHSHNQLHPDDRIALDTALSNWEVDNQNGELILRLNDLAQPLYEVNGQQAYDWHDQASTVIWGLSGRAQDEMKAHFNKLMSIREALIELLWGYKGYNNSLYREHEPYPDWALSDINLLLSEIGEEPLASEEVLTKFVNNNYSLACLRMIKAKTSSLRYAGSFLWLTSSIHLTKPASTKVDLYGNSEAGVFQCLKNSDVAPEGWYQDSPK
ncbi:hypothetical protein [Endozoicomonas sp. OPT23]|uniref:hypothetical protein n=1 Tax=Endozoicomonas sp. OPT23 TaxID=2072845 RepID=UPI00129A5EEF|nr:hypothetical protein [Endozoicomonas sp. OPT23]